MVYGYTSDLASPASLWLSPLAQAYLLHLNKLEATFSDRSNLFSKRNSINHFIDGSSILKWESLSHSHKTLCFFVSLLENINLKTNRNKKVSGSTSYNCQIPFRILWFFFSEFRLKQACSFCSALDSRIHLRCCVALGLIRLPQTSPLWAVLCVAREPALQCSRMGHGP